MKRLQIYLTILALLVIPGAARADSAVKFAFFLPEFEVMLFGQEDYGWYFDSQTVLGESLDITLRSVFGHSTTDNTVGGYRLVQDPNASAELLFQWDGDDQNQNLDKTGLGGVDLTNGGSDDQSDARNPSLTTPVRCCGGVSVCAPPRVPPSSANNSYVREMDQQREDP